MVAAGHRATVIPACKQRKLLVLCHQPVLAAERQVITVVIDPVIAERPIQNKAHDVAWISTKLVREIHLAIFFDYHVDLGPGARTVERG